MSELTQISDKYKEQANELLESKGLVKTLEKYGRVYFTGAYAGKVMMHGDVDITVVQEKPYLIDGVFEIFKSLYFEGKFRSYFIKSDWDDPRMGNEFPNGYYIGLKDKINGEKWKFDIWFVSRKDFEERNKSLCIDKIQLNEEQRESILLLKKYRKENKLDIPGVVIYKAVLDGNCKTIKDFEEYLN
jgi:hypothetical protein